MQLQRFPLPTPSTLSITPHSAQNHRFHLLDGLRGALALLVVLRHSPAYLTGAVQTRNIFLAVDFFFCLSGFVIAYAYEDRLRTKLRLPDFMAARLIRFYPTFLIGTAIAFLVAIGPNHILSQASGRLTILSALPSFVFLPSAAMVAGSLLFPLDMSCWTLLLELIANLGYALLVLTRKRVYLSMAVVCAASWCVLAFNARPLDSGSTWPGALVGCARIGFSFPIGAFLHALWKRVPAGSALRRPRGLPFAACITLALMAVILLPLPFSATRTYQLTIISVVLPTLIFLGADIRMSRVHGVICAALGDLSYPLYILHLPLLSPLFGTRVHHLAQVSSLFRYGIVPAYLVLLATFAWLFRVYVDVPVGRWMTASYKTWRATRVSKTMRTAQATLAQG